MRPSEKPRARGRARAELLRETETALVAMLGTRFGLPVERTAGVVAGGHLLIVTVEVARQPRARRSLGFLVLLVDPEARTATGSYDGRIRQNFARGRVEWFRGPDGELLQRPYSALGVRSARWGVVADWLAARGAA